MGCLLILALLGMPRLGLLWLHFFRDGYITQAFDGVLVWPILGILFFPFTTLAFAYGMNGLGAPGELNPLGWVLIALGILFDLGTSGGANRQRNRKGK